MTVIKSFYKRSENKTYLVGDKYEGEKFQDIEKYVKIEKKKVVKKVKTK